MTEITADMVLRAQQGDEDANRAIIEGLQRPVIATIYRFLGPAYRRDVEDIAQEVFLKVFRALQRFDASRAKFTTWVYTFVRNHCFDILKKKKLKTTSLSAVEDDGSDRDFADARELQPTEGAENTELGRRIGEIVKSTLAMSASERAPAIERQVRALLASGDATSSTGG